MVQTLVQITPAGVRWSPLLAIWFECTILSLWAKTCLASFSSELRRLNVSLVEGLGLRV